MTKIRFVTKTKQVESGLEIQYKMWKENLLNLFQNGDDNLIHL